MAERNQIGDSNVLAGSQFREVLRVFFKQITLTLVVIDRIREIFGYGLPQSDRAVLCCQLRHQLDTFRGDPYDEFGIMLSLFDAQHVASTETGRFAGLPG